MTMPDHKQYEISVQVLKEWIHRTRIQNSLNDCFAKHMPCEEHCHIASTKAPKKIKKNRNKGITTQIF
jgi:hypothetical protein